MMKPRLQTSLGQHLVLTPQLRQALHLLQLSALELEAEIAAAIESNPLLDWAEPEPIQAPADNEHVPAERERANVDDGPDIADGASEWDPAEDVWYDRPGAGT